MNHELHIHQPHQLGWDAARAVARDWVEEARRDFHMECTWTPAQPEHPQEERIGFARRGVSGVLSVRADSFTLRATLGFLLAGFRPAIEARITEQLQARIGHGALEPEPDGRAGHPPA